ERLRASPTGRSFTARCLFPHGWQFKSATLKAKETSDYPPHSICRRNAKTHPQILLQSPTLRRCLQAYSAIDTHGVFCSADRTTGSPNHDTNSSTESWLECNPASSRPSPPTSSITQIWCNLDHAGSASLQRPSLRAAPLTAADGSRASANHHFGARRIPS